jgi:hypothetical protein
LGIICRSIALDLAPLRAAKRAHQAKLLDSLPDHELDVRMQRGDVTRVLRVSRVSPSAPAGGGLAAGGGTAANAAKPIPSEKTGALVGMRAALAIMRTAAAAVVADGDVMRGPELDVRLRAEVSNAFAAHGDEHVLGGLASIQPRGALA